MSANATRGSTTKNSPMLGIEPVGRILRGVEPNGSIGEFAILAPGRDAFHDNRIVGLLDGQHTVGLTARLRAFADCSPVLKQNRSSSHTRHTGMQCGRPSRRVVAIK